MRPHPRLVEAARRRAAAQWAFRAGLEQQAAARFARLAAQLEQLDADAVVIDLAHRATRDEQRHRRLCEALAAHLGTVHSAHPTEAPEAPPVTLGRQCPHERLLAELVAMSCITESLSAALLLEMRRRASDDTVRDAVHEVLRDEVDHARLGWAHLARSSTRAHPGWLGPHLPAMLAATAHEELFDQNSPADTLTAELEGLGALSRQTRRDIFVDTMDTVVLPGLERFGVDVSSARTWLKQRLGSLQGPRAEVLGELHQRLGQR